MIAIPIGPPEKTISKNESGAALAAGWGGMVEETPAANRRGSDEPPS
ncbi:MAG: hypothetical protein RLY70_1878 [Planctomycetota bacterium]|jgi:hypothetical protein